MCGQHAIQASVPDPNLPPNDPDSCPPQLLQQPPVLFKESCSAKVICMDCRSSSSFEGRGGGGVFVIFGWIKKKRMCKWWHQEDRNLQIKISFSLLFQEGEAHRCKHAKTLIDHTAGGQRQPINYDSWSYLEILTMSWQWCKTTLWPWGRCCCCRVQSEGTEAIFIWCQTAELPNHELLRFISPISALSYQGRLEDHWSPW